MSLFETVEIGAGSPRVLITGGVHGDEYEPMVAVRTLIGRLERETLRGTVILAPVVNVSAFLRGERCGEDGLDLARTCPGSATGTITERIAHELSELIRSVDYYVDLHTGGARLRVWPLTGYTLHPDTEVLETQRRMARAFGLPFVWGTDPDLPGRSLSVARQANVPAIYAEYGGGSNRTNLGACSAYFSGCLEILRELRFLEREERPRTEPLIVEDSTPGSGHMQVYHPIPVEGFWHPMVRVGNRVRAGEALGTVSDALGLKVMDVPADRDGLVVVLRACPSVRAGDSAGVVVALAGPTEVLAG
jgi:predicted deacylase